MKYLCRAEEVEQAPTAPRLQFCRQALFLRGGVFPMVWWRGGVRVDDLWVVQQLVVVLLSEPGFCARGIFPFG